MEEKSFEKKDKINKKLIFASSRDENHKGVQTKSRPSGVYISMIDVLNGSDNKIKISIDSDDLPVYIK